MVFLLFKLCLCVLLLHLINGHKLSLVQNPPQSTYTGLKYSTENTTQLRIDNLILGVSLRGATRHVFSKTPTNKRTLIYLLLLMLQNDIETNPGPTKFPCGTCGKAVRNGQRAVCCDRCDMWFHINCQGMPRSTYEAHIDKDFSWTCLNCGLPNLGSSFFSESISSSRNSFSVLSQAESPGQNHPLLTSTPIRRNPQRCKQQLQVLNLNCQSIISKKVEFQHIVSSTQPDIICASETWLSSIHKDGEIGDSQDFQENYNIFRKDRQNRKGGGVLLAVKKGINCDRVPELENNCECVWVKLIQPNGKNLYVASIYRPTASDEHSIPEFRKSLELIPRSASIFIAGDLNFPDVDWSTKLVQAGSNNANVHGEFLDLLEDFMLEQLVAEPTRHENILDLIISNCPSSCKNVTVTAGISDHEAVSCTIDFRPKKKHSLPRELPIYSKADWASLGNHMQHCHNMIVEEAHLQ